MERLARVELASSNYPERFRKPWGYSRKTGTPGRVRTCMKDGLEDRCLIQFEPRVHGGAGGT